ncbi:NifU N-terminal domain-containing protein [bacterium]|nr:NifU N-terminal domain-containing protein [bacterium]
MTPCIRITTRPGHDSCRDYHTTVEISKHQIKHFQRPFHFDKETASLGEIGETGTTLVKSVCAIDGVVEVFISPYDLTVEIGRAFNWEEIEPAVIRAVKRCFGDQADNVEMLPTLPLFQGDGTAGDMRDDYLGDGFIWENYGVSSLK